MISFKNLFDIESKNYYPLVYIPNSLKKTLSDNKFYLIDNKIIIDKYNFKFYEKRPKMPSKPDEYKYEYYQGINNNKFFKNLNRLIFLFILLCLFVVFLTQIIYKHDDFTIGLYLMFFGPFALVAIILIGDALKNMFNSKNQKMRTVKKSELEILKDNEFYEENFKFFVNDVKTYEDSYRKFINGLDMYKDDYIYEKYLQEIKSKITISRIDDVKKKGKSEDNFLKYLLKKSIGNEFMIDIAVNMNNYTLYPDFLFVSKNKDFCIDIEIDERYDYKSKKPIHFIGSDNDRNDFFLNSNCFVIRFTEEQVVEEPENCCKFIEDIVNVICKPQSYSLKTKIKRVIPWTYEQAYLQAKENYRSE